jgi:hypothetical protein
MIDVWPSDSQKALDEIKTLRAALAEATVRTERVETELVIVREVLGAIIETAEFRHIHVTIQMMVRAFLERTAPPQPEAEQ